MGARRLDHVAWALPPTRSGELWTLGPDEARHLVQVLRAEVGACFWATCGQNRRLWVELRQVRKQGATLAILADEPVPPLAPLGLAFGLPKDRDRLEWLLEKSIELGVTHFYPLLTQRTHRSRWNRERVYRLLRAALKQCGRFDWPTVAEPALPSWELLAAWPVRALATCADAPGKVELKAYLTQAGPGAGQAGRLVAIGPEGDFTGQEVADALAAGLQPTTLGPLRLRTETAALAALVQLGGAQYES